MGVVHLPFLPRFREPMLADIKLATSRTRKYAEPGDTFEAWGSHFIVERVERMSLGHVAGELWPIEGVESRDEFVAVWAAIHPSGYDAERKVWVHVFRRRGSPASYPENWVEISREVRSAAGWKCERCGAADDAKVGRILTVNHMDMDPTNCRRENLAALCQRCHLYVQSRGFPRSLWQGQKQAELQDFGGRPDGRA